MDISGNPVKTKYRAPLRRGSLSREVEGLGPVKPGNLAKVKVPIPPDIRIRQMRSAMDSLILRVRMRYFFI